MRAEKATVTPMDPRVRRFELPSGGWWDLIVRPTWGDIKPITAALRTAQADEMGQEDQLDTIVAALTTEWSFPEPVEAASVGARDLVDMIPIMRVVVKDILPLFDGLHDES